MVKCRWIVGLTAPVLARRRPSPCRGAAGGGDSNVAVTSGYLHVVIDRDAVVMPDNAAGLLRQPEMDGALIGGASLNADRFLAIVQDASY